MIRDRYLEEAGNDGSQAGGAEGAGAQHPGDWKESLPEELRSEPVIQQTKDIPSLAKQLVHAQRMLGGSIRIPGKDAGQEDWDKFYSRLQEVPGVARIPTDPSQDQEGTAAVLKKLGWPESPDKYQVNVPEDAGLDPEFVQANLKALHEIGLTQQQAQAYMDRLAEQHRNLVMEEQKEEQERQALLQQKFGQALERVQFDAAAAAKQLGGDEAAQALAEAGLLEDPHVLSVLSKAAELLKESGTQLPEHSGQMGGLTPDEARAQIQEMWNNKDHPLHHSTHPHHQSAVQRYYELHRYLSAR